MNDRELQHEFDDELLSAYLDDELSTEELAAVEARLAEDPAARQLVDQLRSVSQDVQSLPEESLAHDLRERILEKAAEAKRDQRSLADSPAAQHTATNGATPSLIEPIAKFPVGRSRRGWAWAAMAVAAALLIMFLQPRDGQQGDLSPVAQHDSDREVERVGSQADRLVRDKTVSESGATIEDLKEAVPAAEPAEPAAGRLDVAGGGAGGARAALPTAAPESVAFETIPQAPMAAGPGARPVDGLKDLGVAGTAGAPAPADVAVMDESAAAPEGAVSGTFGGRAAGAAPGEAAEIADQLAATEEKPDAVVHVVAKRAALEQKSIDKLLAKCNIDVESVAEANKTPARRLEEDESTAGSEAPEPNGAVESKNENASDVDVVVVDAPPSAIFSCVNELNQDATNYLSVEVEESLPEASGGSGVGGLKLKGLVDSKSKQLAELTKLNRGAVPQEQKQQFARAQGYLYERSSAHPVAEPRARVDRNTNAPSETSSPVAVESPDEESRALGRGRAWRIGDQGGYDFYGGSRDALSDPRLVKLRSRVIDSRFGAEADKLKAAAGAENMRVLLFICPEDATPASATGENPTK